MRRNDDAGAATAEPAATPPIARRFTRAAEAERSRLKGRREQLLAKREEVQAELGSIDRGVDAIDELLELLAPLLAGNGSESAAASDGSNAQAEPGGPGSNGGEPRGRDDAEH